jgi:hypothetical protein
MELDEMIKTLIDGKKFEIKKDKNMINCVRMIL